MREEALDCKRKDFRRFCSNLVLLIDGLWNCFYALRSYIGII